MKLFSFALTLCICLIFHCALIEKQTSKNTLTIIFQELGSSVATKPVEVCHSPGEAGQKRMNHIHLFTRTSMEVIQVSALWNAPLHSAHYCSRAFVKRLNPFSLSVCLLCLQSLLTPHSLQLSPLHLCCRGGYAKWGYMRCAQIHCILTQILLGKLWTECWIKIRCKSEFNSTTIL